MGPYKSLTNAITEVAMQANEVSSLIYRMRQANRRLTGSCGEQPINAATPPGRGDRAFDESPPLLVGLTMSMEHLNSAIAELRDEVIFLESISETNQDTMMVAKAPR